MQNRIAAAIAELHRAQDRIAAAIAELHRAQDRIAAAIAKLHRAQDRIAAAIAELHRAQAVMGIVPTPAQELKTLSLVELRARAICVRAVQRLTGYGDDPVNHDTGLGDGDGDPSLESLGLTRPNPSMPQ